MKKLIEWGVALVGVLFSGWAFAGNAAPLGLELGVVSYAQVKQQLGSKTVLSAAGTNQYSGGRMLQSDGAGLEIEGLSEITFIFDRTDKLAAVLMKMPKGDGMGDLESSNFKRTLNTLAAKYTLDEKRVPFVGDAYAKLHQGDAIIELSAPHMGFGMELRYFTTSFDKAFRQQSSNERAAKARRQAGAL
ncbi:hypothetical protein [Ferriphaselus sp. R-1]|uniref:hypothetical protein n=1 Tax=Ferriphaselus sp. R-1 TaxID=1485544 RepID=UPI0012687997|nr:hypothetical protein [Ferriphaselus sp. R-1]